MPICLIIRVYVSRPDVYIYIHICISYISNNKIILKICDKKQKCSTWTYSLVCHLLQLLVTFLSDCWLERANFSFKPLDKWYWILIFDFLDIKYSKIQLEVTKLFSVAMSFERTHGENIKWLLIESYSFIAGYGFYLWPNSIWNFHIGATRRGRHMEF